MNVLCLLSSDISTTDSWLVTSAIRNFTYIYNWSGINKDRKGDFLVSQFSIFYLLVPNGFLEPKYFGSIALNLIFLLTNIKLNRAYLEFSETPRKWYQKCKCRITWQSIWNFEVSKTNELSKIRHGGEHFFYQISNYVSFLTTWNHWNVQTWSPISNCEQIKTPQL